ncbi:MAG: DUF4307 domain-containing protein [Rhodoluna sp.]|nr:DUF4307 domain-containing protein [Rhodoluna sp.]
MQQLPEQIAQRYGKSPQQEGKRRLAIIITASLFALLFIIWASWAALTAKNDPTFKTTSFEVLDTTNTSVSFVVTKPANTTAICAIQALKEDYGVVAYKEVIIPASGSEDGSITDVPVKTKLRTTELAVTGLVDRCWFE